MKKILFTGLLSVFVSVVIAQLKIMPDGKVGIGTSAAPISKFAVGTAGSLSHSYSFEGDSKPFSFYIKGLGNSNNAWSAALYVETLINSSTLDRGIQADAGKASPSTTGRAVGISGIAYNATDGYNYGVIGCLSGNNNGTGILGDANGNHVGIYIDAKYAGYFNGNVKVTGTINGTVVGNSDIRYKQNIVELGAVKGNDSELKRITGLVPISYNFKQVYYDLKSDTLMSPVGHFDEKSQAFQKKHYGLIAQDLQNVYPDLVYENDNGYLAINYTELIPLLIQSIKELKEEVEILSAAFVNTRSTTPNDILDETPRAVLYQNMPNPFSERTEIKFALPQNKNRAFIYVFNMQGALVKQIPVNNQQQSIIINGSELTAGMYLYSLIVDGKEVDTKRMILTK